MNYLKHIALAILFGAILSVSAYADGKPGSGGPGNGGPGKGDPMMGMHFGLSDSCWNVFVSSLSAADQAKLAADQATITGNQTLIDTLNRQIGALIKSSLGKRDSATRAKINALEMQLDSLQRANGAAQMDIDTIIKTNQASFQTVAENCGRPNKGGGGRDTIKGGGHDSTKGDGGPHDKDRRGHFGLSDSCWNIFLTQISTADAAALAADQKIIADNKVQIDSLMKVLRGLKGNRKDSTVRTEMKALIDQINALIKASVAAQKDYASIIKKNETILQSIRQDCGRNITHKGNPGDPTNGFQVSDIVPNPAPVGGTASVTITLTADAPVIITISNAIAQGPPAKEIFNGTLTSGSHVETLDLTGLSAGVYMVAIQSGNAMVMKKFVIQ